MPDKLRIGALGLSHDHIWENLKSLNELSDGVLVAAADPHPELQEQVRSYGCEHIFADYGEMLDSVPLDAVYIYADNRHGVDLALQAAARGLHIMIEKPMASTLAGADRIRSAARTAGVQLMINWPIAWWPHLQYALQLVAAGRIGEVFQVNYRAAHGGPREYGHSRYFYDWLYDPRLNGGGALADYCGYGAALTCLLLGLPSRVTAVSGRLRKEDLPAEDNAVLIMQHARAISTTTASWTQIGMMTSYVPTFYGSEGTLAAHYQDGTLWLATNDQKFGEPLDVPPLLAGKRTAAEFFLKHIRSGEPIGGLCGAEVGLMAQEVVEAGLHSAAEGRTVSLPLPVSVLRAEA